MNVVKNSWDNKNVGNLLGKIEFCYLKLEEWGGGKMKELSEKVKNRRWML